jgi:hypothetical protein
MRRPQFSLKTMLWLPVCVACIFLGIANGEPNERRRLQAAYEEQERKRVEIPFDSAWRLGSSINRAGQCSGNHRACHSANDRATQQEACLHRFSRFYPGQLNGATKRATLAFLSGATKRGN